MIFIQVLSFLAAYITIGLGAAVLMAAVDPSHMNTYVLIVPFWPLWVLFKSVNSVPWGKLCDLIDAWILRKGKLLRAWWEKRRKNKQEVQ